MADAAEADRPPRFLEDEMVRVVGVTGSETFQDGQAYDAASLVGEELKVMDAHPNSNADGWLIAVWGGEKTDGWKVLFSEDSLTSTGLKHAWDEDGEVLLPLDRAEEPGWRNQIELFLVPDLTEEEATHHPLLEWLSAHPERMEDPDQMTEAAEIGWRAAAVLGEFVEADQEVGLAFAEDDHDDDDEEDEEDIDRHPFGIHLWFQPAGEIFSAFDRIISSPAREWEHDIEEGMFFTARWPASHWRRPTGEDAVFITPGIREAVVICKCWTTPRWHWAHKSPLP